MPPKAIQKKHRKPLTPLQRKQRKRKQELIHKAQVKSQYYKQLNKEKDDDVPDYVKEIFAAERTIDEKGNVVEMTPEVTNDEEQHVERVYDLDKVSSSEEEDDDDEEDAGRHRKHKPNPFKNQLEERERRKRETEEERQERLKKMEEAKQAKQEYQKHRREQRGKMLSKTKRGQPNMAAQMDVLLEKIQQKKL